MFLSFPGIFSGCLFDPVWYPVGSLLCCSNLDFQSQKRLCGALFPRPPFPEYEQCSEAIQFTFIAVPTYQWPIEAGVGFHQCAGSPVEAFGTIGRDFANFHFALRLSVRFSQSLNGTSPTSYGEHSRY